MDQSRTELAALGEFGLIDRLTAETEIYNASTVLGVGDDAAVIDTFGKQMVVSTDMLVEDVHFDLMYMPLKHLGYKSVVVNLSDIYAMNAQPEQITVSIAVSNRISVEALDELYAGIHLACNKYGVDLIGGDTTTSPKGLMISITAIGSVAENKWVGRKGAGETDLVCVSGNLGAAYTGLLLLEREKKIFLETPGIQPDLGNQAYVLERILKPEARRDVIDWFAQQEVMPSSMIDISDGLSSELLHLCRNSNTGCVIYEDKIPLHEETRENAATFNIPPLTCALNGGEDYELLFTLDLKYFETASRCPLFSIIGHMAPAGSGEYLITNGNHRIELNAQGWNSLKK